MVRHRSVHQEHSASSAPSATQLTRIWPLAAVALIAGVLWGTRPTATGRSESAEVERTRGCLSNLNRIASAFAQYAHDYDGKFPRGVDAEDRHQPQTWQLRLPNGK